MTLNIFEKGLFKIFSIGNRLGYFILDFIPYFKFIKETRNTQTPITFRTWFNQKILGTNRYAYWPVNKSSIVTNPKNIYAGIETAPGLMPGCYIQAIGKIYIGDYTQIAPNVGIISANHDLYDNRKHNPGIVKIGKYCWIGMGALIMPDVVLGDYTIVGAGSVVTKSFEDGYCVIAGNPARLIKRLDINKCVIHRSKYEYNGYVKSELFDKFRKKYLNV